MAIGLRLIDLSAVDDVKQTLEGDYAVRLTWQDDSLSEFAGCELPLDSVWSPSIVFFNSGRMHASRPREVTVSAGRQVRYLQRSMRIDRMCRAAFPLAFGTMLIRVIAG